jgi:acetyl esterase/lipase
VPSPQHQFLARVVPVLRRRGEVDDADALRRRVLAEQARAVTDPPARTVRGCEVTTRTDLGFPVHELRVRGTDPGRAVLYLHGGGYVAHADPGHWRYVVRLARRLDARVVLPVYPLAPQWTWRDSHPAGLSLFEQLAIESPRGVVLAGDSAGGGFALALAQQLAARPEPQPTHLVLLSPWLDLTNAVLGTAEANARDPWLRLTRLRLAGSWWAGGDDETRPEVSPLYGDPAGLPPTLMFCGTLDTFHPQCRELVRRAEGTGWDLAYVEEPDLLHVFPILPVRNGPALRPPELSPGGPGVAGGR